MKNGYLEKADLGSATLVTLTAANTGESQLPTNKRSS
jgi:hypothetical protein